MYTPDQTDWKIIELLMQDGRLSSAEISRKLGNVSARTVTNRIEVLTKHQVIDIRSIVNPNAIGYGVLADVFLEVEPRYIRSVADRLAELPQISYLALTTGETDILTSVRARTVEDLFNFVLEVIGNIPGVRHTNTYPLSLNIKDITAWMPPGMGSKINKEPSRPGGGDHER